MGRDTSNEVEGSLQEKEKKIYRTLITLIATSASENSRVLKNDFGKEKYYGGSTAKF